jgi:hypothetical protein
VDELGRRVSPEGVVLAGPFQGLRMETTGTWGGNAARLAGCYEEELTDTVEAIIASRPRRIVDIGAAEGYYAVGFARAVPSAEVVAFELEHDARQLCKRNAALNGVRVKVRGRATPATLQRELRPGTVVLSDCEGYEIVLMDPAAVPGLAQCLLIIEMHEFAVPGVTAAVLDRFTSTHELQMIDARPRTASGRTQLAHLPSDVAEHAVQEGRPAPPMQWAVLRPVSV